MHHTKPFSAIKEDKFENPQGPKLSWRKEKNQQDDYFYPNAAPVNASRGF
jgi:hypothetical protein